ncbi:MAG TPA: M20/M25/M40 family metallo-hydrolase [Caulobacteraceae bacterium]|jgi:acetylornithine deacetylase/succinyl-diaminopimelate desuccinylase-like protein|nr:M20/M25/M40 family metallo-hydrolase [Caulobacteraceae bacterium]
MKSLLIAASTWALAAGLASAAPAASTMPPPEYKAMSHDILKELIEINSVHKYGSTIAAHAIEKRLLDAGYNPADVVFVAPPDHPTKGNLVVRVHGNGLGKPILFHGHLDVVEALPQDWTVDPFKLTEKDGYFYGRGTSDMKGDDSAMLTALIRMKKEGFVPDRDIIVAFTADEEAEGDANGPDYLFKNRPELVNAGEAFNADSGGGGLKNGKPIYYGIQTSEKLYATYVFETENKGGHSSEPRADNAIYELAHALLRVEAYKFPVHLTETTRGFFAEMAQLETGQVKADMLAVAQPQPDLAAADRLSVNTGDNALLRTTCVATLLSGGDAENALPQRARGVIQCRLIPGESVESVQAQLAKVADDPGVKVSLSAPVKPSGESKLTPDITKRYETVIHSMWPGLPVVPWMDAGASDSVYTRAVGIPSYGSSSIFGDVDDVRAHGRDERVGVDDYYRGVEFTYRLMKAMSAR